MNKLKIHLLLILFSLLSSTQGAFSQNSDYKDLMEVQNVLNREAFLFRLLDFQNDYPQFTNVYYQLGKLQLEILSEFDPLVDRTASRQYLYNSKINFGLAKNYLDEKEARKNYEWYDVPNIKKNDSLIAAVIRQVDTKYEELSRYLDDYEKLIFHYDHAVSNYLQARQSFIDINTRAENLRALFLTANDALKDEIRQVGSNFDSTLFHLEQYKLLYQKMPYKKKRKANIVLQEIDYYRMNGITPSNFLSDNLELWNYKSWSENFISLIEEEVDGLKHELSEAYETFSDINTRMLTSRECIQVDVDDMKLQRLINLVSKYDNQSLLIDLYRYLMAKLKYSNQLVYETNCNVSAAQPTDHLLSRKARIYQTIYGYLKLADSLNTQITSSGHNTASFQWFFDKYLPGANGGTEFTTTQSNENRKSFRQGIKDIQSLQQQQYLLHDTISHMFALRSDTLLTTFDSTETNMVIAEKSLIMDSLYSIFLVRKKSDLYSLTGVRRIENGYKVYWEEFLEKGQKPDFFKVLSDSSFAIGGTGKTLWMKHLDLFGARKANLSIASLSPLQNLYYNDLTENYSLVQESSYDTLAQQGAYVITNVNSTGKNIGDWKLNLPGKFVTMTSQDTTLWLFSHSLKAGSSNITATVIHRETKEQINEISYQYAAEMDQPMIIKNDNTSLTVLGKKAEDKEGLIYSIIDYNGIIRDETDL